MEGGGGNFLYMVKYECGARIAPFFSSARYMNTPPPPLITMYMKSPFLLGNYIDMNEPLFVFQSFVLFNMVILMFLYLNTFSIFLLGMEN